MAYEIPRPHLIHAGKSKGWIDEYPDDPISNYGIKLSEMTFGAILGVAEIIDCLSPEAIFCRDEQSDKPDHDHWLTVKANTEHIRGPWCWVLKNAKRFNNPIPYRGAQGIFDVADDDIPADLIF